MKMASFLIFPSIILSELSVLKESLKKDYREGTYSNTDKTISDFFGRKAGAFVGLKTGTMVGNAVYPVIGGMIGGFAGCIYGSRAGPTLFSPKNRQSFFNGISSFMRTIMNFIIGLISGFQMNQIKNI
jgi:uncharacterized membrane protein